MKIVSLIVISVAVLLTSARATGGLEDINKGIDDNVKSNDEGIDYAGASLSDGVGNLYPAVNSIAQEGSGNNLRSLSQYSRNRNHVNRNRNHVNRNRNHVNSDRNHPFE